MLTSNILPRGSSLGPYNKRTEARKFFRLSNICSCKSLCSPLFDTFHRGMPMGKIDQIKISSCSLILNFGDYFGKMCFSRKIGDLNFLSLMSNRLSCLEGFFSRSFDLIQKSGFIFLTLIYYLNLSQLLQFSVK